MRSCTRRPIAKILLTALLAAPAARAEIAGEQVVSGTAAFDQSGNVITITASDGAIINYSHFGVLASEEMHFLQPSSESRVLNRVFGDATHIDGGLYANGIVYIVNPAGIYFGDGAIIDVGGLYAAAGDISNEDFLARIDRFALSGLVENAGSIESPAVALVGTRIANHGNIHAPDGTIALVAGEKVILTQLGAHLAVEVEGVGGSAEAPAIEQAGSVDAGAGAVSYTTGDVYSLAINHTGITRGREIELRAESGTVQVAGTLDASDRSAGATGGSIAVTGERVALLGAQLDASGDAGGGAIRVGGDLHGEGALPTARRTYVDDGSSLRADAISSGDGGRVIVWADEATAFHGAVSARGGAAGGDGGFAEISGAAFLEADGDVDLGAPSGATGTLLYDPKDIMIVGGGTPIVPMDGSDDPNTSPDQLVGSSVGQVLFDTPDELLSPFTIHESEIERTDANIVLEATNSIYTDDAGAFDGAVTLSSNRSLTMRTRNNLGDETASSAPLGPGIHLDGVSFQTSGTGAITIATGTDGAGGGGTGSAAGIEIGNLTTAGRAVTLTTKDGAIEVGDVTTAGANGTAQAIAGSAGGAISIVARDKNQSVDSDVTTGLLDSSGGDGAGGTDGAGGSGGPVTVQSIGTLKDVEGTATDPVLGGGDITVAGITTMGGEGKGTGAGGAGGRVVIGGRVNVNPFTGQEDVVDPTDGAITVAGKIDTSGGQGTGTGSAGGSAGAITIIARDANRDNANDITTAELIARGGNGVATGGAGGAVTIETLKSIEITGATNSGDNQVAAGGGDIDFDHIDTSEGTPKTSSADGGSILLVSEGGAIDHGAQAGPHIVTNGSVTLDATGGVGASSPIVITAGGETADRLFVAAGGRADVRVTTGFFGALVAVAKTVAADIDITQSGGDVIDVSPSGGNMFVHRIDGTGNNVDMEIQLQDADGAASDAALVLENGSVTAGGLFRAFSEGNIVLGTATSGSAPVIEASSKDPDLASNVLLSADSDRDGSGAIVDGDGTTGVINMLGESVAPGALTLLATGGIGTEAEPIVTTGGTRLSALNSPRTSAGDPDPTATSGVYLRNISSGEVTIASGVAPGVGIGAGTGEIQIENQAGDIRVNASLRAMPDDSVDGAGGDLTLTVNPGSEIVLNTSQEIASGGLQTYKGNVALAGNASVIADGGVDINGGLDTSDDAASPAGFTATLGDEATDVTMFKVSGGVGDTLALGSFAIRSPDGGKVALDTPLVRTTGSQTYSADLDLAQFIELDAGTQIRFDKAGEQTVTGPAGFSLGTSGVSISPEATIAKPNGNLTLESTGGSILIGDGEKLSVAGSLEISAPTGTVRFTDLSALDISVTSLNAPQVFARAPAPVATPSGATIQDGGTDLVANTVAFNTAPTIVGGGPAPRIATASGTAQNAGALPVVALPVPISAADIALGSRVFDLAIPAIDPGHETQEIPTSAVEPALEPQPSRDRAGPAAPVTREEVAAFFACAPVGAEAMPAGCTAAPAPPPYGSALDTERAVEIARAYRDLLGDSPDAAAGRASLARAAADPRAEVGHASSPAGRVYLTEVARVLGQVRLLGLGERYAEVRADLLAAVAAAIGSPQLDAARLGRAVDARAMGMPIQVSAATPGG